MENKKLFKVIDDYIMGLLDDKERNEFQALFEKDASLVEEVKLRQEVIKGIEAHGRHSLKNQLKDIHKEVINSKQKSAPKTRTLWRYVAAAASVLLLLFAGYWFNSKSSISSDQLYATHFKPYDITDMQRSVSDPSMLEIEQLYTAKKYDAVLPLLENKLSTLNPQPSQLLLATGITQMELGNVQEALTYFEKITANNDFNFRDEVRWYTALAYLRIEDIKSARISLQPLATDTNADHHLSAKKLLLQIGKIK